MWNRVGFDGFWRSAMEDNYFKYFSLLNFWTAVEVSGNLLRSLKSLSRIHQSFEREEIRIVLFEEWKRSWTGRVIEIHISSSASWKQEAKTKKRKFPASRLHSQPFSELQLFVAQSWRGRLSHQIDVHEMEWSRIWVGDERGKDGFKPAVEESTTPLITIVFSSFDILNKQFFVSGHVQVI